MRGFLTGLSVSLAFIIGCVAGSSQFVVPKAHAEGEHVVVEQRWAYFCFDENNVDAVNFKANAAGARGWELVAASPRNDGVAVWCFRQPRP